MLGTVNYMSPEQARGEANLTAQSDQFSLGLVLYELAAGKRAFQRQSAPETMAAMIREEADRCRRRRRRRWLDHRTPAAKDAAERYDSTRDLFGSSGRSATGSLMPRVLEPRARRAGTGPQRAAR